jgi:fumarate reductase subunit D
LAYKISAENKSVKIILVLAIIFFAQLFFINISSAQNLIPPRAYPVNPSENTGRERLSEFNPPRAIPVSGQTIKPTTLNDLPSIFKYILNLINSYIIPIIIGLAVVAFLWGMFKLINAGDDEGKRKEAKDIIIYGIVGLFVMVSVWGLVNILVGTFGFNFMLPSLPPQQ